MPTDRVDRTLSLDPKTVMALDGSDVYHEVGREDPVMSDCGLAPAEGDRKEPTETEAIEADLRRCGRCDFEEPVGIYAAGAKEFHRPVEKAGGHGSACPAIATAMTRQGVVRRGAAALLFNGIDACPDCWDTSDGSVTEPSDHDHQ